VGWLQAILGAISLAREILKYIENSQKEDAENKKMTACEMKELKNAFKNKDTKKIEKHLRDLGIFSNSYGVQD
jgi:hypothetical protein